MNQSGFIRTILKNQDSGPTTTILQTLENDLGYQFSMGLTSSTFNTTGPNRNNQGIISLNSPNSMGFLIRYNKPFSWRINPANDGDLLNQTEIMRLKPEGNLILPLGGINTSGNITTTQIGFFSFLGSFANRITKLFVQDIDALGNINVSGNITSSGDVCIPNKCLSALGINIPAASSINPFNQNLNTTDSPSFVDVTAVNGFFLYLGGLANRTTKLFVQNIDASNDVVIGRNLEVAENTTLKNDLLVKNNAVIQGDLEAGKGKLKLSTADERVIITDVLQLKPRPKAPDTASLGYIYIYMLIPLQKNYAFLTARIGLE